MSDHLPAETLRRYRDGELPPDELLAADAHLAACADCRARGSSGVEVAGAIRALASARPMHPEYDRLEAYADGRLEADDRDAVDSHLATCPTCREDVGDLRQVRAELSMHLASDPTAAATTRSQWFSWRGVMAGLTTLGAAAAIAWLVAPGANPTSPASDRLADDAALPPPRLALRDGALALTLDGAGRLTGLPADVPSGVRDRAEQVLASGRLALPDTLATLHGPAGPLMGSGAERAALAPVRPLGTVVAADRPTFEWTAYPGASVYRVTVFDSRFEEVADSGQVRGTTWTPDRPLPRGVTLSWQIAATTSRGVVNAPVPPAAEARFRVADAATMADIDALRVTGSHLLLAIAYTEAGLLDAAAAELEALESENPQSPVVAALLDSVRSGR